MLILLDQDGVLADFETGFFKAWGTRYPELAGIHPSRRQSFYLRDDYPEHLQPQVESVYTQAGFFRDLVPIEGAIEGVRQLMEQGHDVRICTSPLNQYRHCVLEKYEWIEAHLGFEFTHRMMVSKDKTLVRGDVLVDDKPHITGTLQPTWRHILFDQPYNRGHEGTRANWSTLAAVLH